MKTTHACSQLGKILEPELKSALNSQVKPDLKLKKEDVDYILMIVINCIEDTLCS